MTVTPQSHLLCILVAGVYDPGGLTTGREAVSHTGLIEASYISCLPHRPTSAVSHTGLTEASYIRQSHYRPATSESNCHWAYCPWMLKPRRLFVGFLPLLACPFGEYRGIEPADWNARVGRRIPNDIDQCIPAVIIVNVDEAFRSLEKRQDVQLLGHGSAPLRFD